MKTLKNFKEYCGESLGALVNPVKAQTGCDLADFWQEMEDVSKSPCGAAGGFTGFIWYSETVAFWRKNRQKIYKLMKEQSEGLGENVLGMVCGFNGLKDYEAEDIARALFGNYNSDYDQIYNVFAWYALEEVAFYYSEWCYENNF